MGVDGLFALRFTAFTVFRVWGEVTGVQEGMAGVQGGVACV